jgi:hypothetical protein
MNGTDKYIYLFAELHTLMEIIKSVICVDHECNDTMLDLRQAYIKSEEEMRN